MCNPEAENLIISVNDHVYVLQIKDILLPVPLSYTTACIGSCCIKV